MKQRFQISVIRTDGTVLHTGQVTCETAEELATKIRAVANTVKGLDLESMPNMSPHGASENRIATGRS
jgi:hypothetical protein